MNWERRGSIRSPRPTFQNPNFESMRDLSFSVENKMSNLHQKFDYILNLTEIIEIFHD